MTNRPRQPKFSLLELLLAMALVALLTVLILPAQRQARQRVRERRAVVEMRGLLQLIMLYRSENYWAYPLHMHQFLDPPPRDPWGNPYVYNHFETILPGMMRKDRNMTPINSDFDLYSKGRDGKSHPPLTAAASRDDIIVAKDGAYVGPVRNY